MTAKLLLVYAMASVSPPSLLLYRDTSGACVHSVSSEGSCRVGQHAVAAGCDASLWVQTLATGHARRSLPVFDSVGDASRNVVQKKKKIE